MKDNPGKTKKLLIVDDNKSIHTLFTGIFKNSDFQVASAKNGEEALELLRWDDFDIIFVDLVMPKVYGLDLIKKIQDIKHKKNLKIVIMTGAEADDLVNEALGLGALCCLYKPFEAKEVLEITNKYN